MRAVVLALGFVSLGFSAGVAASPFADGAQTRLSDILSPLRATPVSVTECAPVAVDIYFDRDESDLSGSAQATLDSITERVSGCKIAAVAIETTNSEETEAGRKMAGLRGASLLKALSTRGITPAAVVIADNPSAEPASAGPTPEHVRVWIKTAQSPVRQAPKRAPAIPDDEI